MDKSNNKIVLSFNDNLAIECFNKFKEKHGFKNEDDVIRAAYLIMLSLDQHNNLQFLQNGDFIIQSPGVK